MAITTTITYTGDLHTDATHVRSGDQISTDAPIDNGGKGTAFSPTDLVATALGTCILTIMGKAADRDGIDMTGATAEVTKTMSASPRRISAVDVEIQMPDRDYSDKEKASLERAAKHCPVANSLHPDLAERITIHWSR